MGVPAVLYSNNASDAKSQLESKQVLLGESSLSMASSKSRMMQALQKSLAQRVEAKLEQRNDTSGMQQQLSNNGE